MVLAPGTAMLLPLDYLLRCYTGSFGLGLKAIRLTQLCAAAAGDVPAKGLSRPGCMEIRGCVRDLASVPFLAFVFSSCHSWSQMLLLEAGAPLVVADGIVSTNAQSRSLSVPNSFADFEGTACWMITDTASPSSLWMYPYSWERKGPEALSNSPHLAD